jgi:hypothetical protein
MPAKQHWGSSFEWFVAFKTKTYPAFLLGKKVVTFVLQTGQAP